MFFTRFAEILRGCVDFGLVVLEVASASGCEDCFDDVQVFASQLTTDDVIENLLRIGVVLVEVRRLANENDLFAKKMF